MQLIIYKLCYIAIWLYYYYCYRIIILLYYIIDYVSQGFKQIIQVDLLSMT